MSTHLDSVKRKCSACRKNRLLKFFPANRSKKYGRGNTCRPCQTVANKEWASKNKKAVHRIHQRAWLKRKYNLTCEEYDEMFAAQKGVCAICKLPDDTKGNGKNGLLCVDHDHKTGVIRALLCDRCNRAIGLMKENPERLREAAAYLERHSDDLS